MYATRMPAIQKAVDSGKLKVSAEMTKEGRLAPL